MSLTPEERQRIYEEEKARFEAQERVKSERQKNKVGCGQGCLFIILGLVIIGAIGAGIDSLSHHSAPSSSQNSTQQQNSALTKLDPMYSYRMWQKQHGKWVMIQGDRVEGHDWVRGVDMATCTYQASAWSDLAAMKGQQRPDIRCWLVDREPRWAVPGVRYPNPYPGYPYTLETPSRETKTGWDTVNQWFASVEECKQGMQDFQSFEKDMGDPVTPARCIDENGKVVAQLGSP